MSKRPRHHGGQSSSNTTPHLPSKLFPLACSAKSFSPLGHSLSFLKKISSLGGRLLLFLWKLPSADFGLGSEARHGTQNDGGVTRGLPARAQSKLPRTRNYNHKLCRAAINTRQTTVTHPRGQCSESQSYASGLRAKVESLFLPFLSFFLLFTWAEHCMSSSFLKGTLLAVLFYP